MPKIEDYATIESYCGGVPVYAFGFTYIYGVSPDLLPGVKLQVGNQRPVTKITPRKSWEIKHNLCGSTPGREPKTTMVGAGLILLGVPVYYLFRSGLGRFNGKP